MLQPAPVQSVYNRYVPVGQNGMLVDETNAVTDTRIVETAAGIGFGLAVSQGVNDKGCIIAGSNFVGVTRADQTLPRADVTPQMVVDTYNQYDNAAILKEGDIWVNCYGVVQAGVTAVTYDATGKLGAAGTTITYGRWQTSASGSPSTPVLAVLRLGSIASK